MSTWVQHKSAIGDKWEVVKHSSCHDTSWHCKSPLHDGHMFLPKSEYNECSPPVQWVDITGECDIKNDSIYYKDENIHTAAWNGHNVYRLKHVYNTGFIVVERRKVEP